MTTTPEDDDQTTFLLAKLEVVRDPEACLGRMEEAMNEFCGACFAMEETDDFQTMVDSLVDKGVTEMLLGALKRWHPFPNYYHKTIGSLVFFAANSGYPSCQEIVDKGGFVRVLELMEALRPDEFIQYTCVSFLATIAANMKNKAEISAATAENVVKTLEVHNRSADLYVAACKAIGGCFGPGSKIPVDVHHRSITCVWHGITIHADNEEAQEIGRSLLKFIVGEKHAKELIDHSEMHHCEGGCA
jgi:hypothetical protein